MTLLPYNRDLWGQIVGHLTIQNITIVLVLGLLTYRALLPLQVRIKPPLPPGPPGEFLLGHYRIVPENAAFKKYAKWAKQYNSDVLYFQTFGTKWIVLNSLQAATELLDKRGSNYADRPQFVMFEEMGWSPTLTWLRWGPKYHLHRKVLQPPFTKSRVGRYQASQLREALICCKGMLNDPENWVTAVRRFAVAIVLKISYGLDVDSPDSQWIKLAEESAEAIGKSGAPASSIMDQFPLTRYLPPCLPFMERLRYARTWRHAIEDITRIPFEAAMSTSSTSSPQSFVHNRMSIHSSNTKQNLPNDFTIDDIKGAAATIVIAGNDTTTSTLMLLILYLLKNPHCQLKAQSEIDLLTQPSPRLPNFPDLPHLPYTNLLLQETYRMNPLSPLGIPHASLLDDVYNGLFIPKGTIIYQNVWAMNHDPAIYSDPDQFIPERYLPKNEEGGRGEPLPQGNFGFGRRICIGKHLAENSLLIVLAVMLAACEIGEPENGEVGEEWSFRGQAIVLPFRASFTARSERMRELLDEAVRGLEKADIEVE